MKLINHKITSNIGTQQSKFIRKFFQKASVVKNENPNYDLHKYTVQLDKKQIKTPLMNIICVPSYTLATLIANEFNFQEDYLNPALMPLYTLAKVATDLSYLPEHRKVYIVSIVSHLLHDTIHFLSPNEKLSQLQQQSFQPILNHINSKFNLSFQFQKGLFGNKFANNDQKSEFQAKLENLNDFQLMALEQITSNLKSASIAIALTDKTLDIQQACDLSRTEENYQIDLCGKVEGNHDLDENTTLVNVSSAQLFYEYGI